MPESVTQWLEQLGLGQYAEGFEENAIGLEHLPDLDHETLKEIGVPIVGHRMTLLKAAAKLEAPPVERRQDGPTAAHTGEGERRRLTVMFCGLADSTELVQRLLRAEPNTSLNVSGLR
jgi:class 3 adenylate cyclase